MITRKIGKIVRGKQTPFHLLMACILGSLIGFVPGLAQGAGWLLFLLLLLVILNANLFLAAVVGLLAKVVSLPLLPLSVAIGRILLDGPTQPVFKWAINAPVLALFGFDYYATTGGIIIGLLFGTMCAIAAIAIVRSTQRRIMRFEEKSERYQRFKSKRSVGILSWIFLGPGKGKKTWEQVLARKIGNPIRTLGVIFAAGVIALLAVLNQLFAEPIVTSIAKRGLERVNGATVDLDSASLDLKEGRLEIHGLAMTDPNDLATNLLQAERLVADVSAADLLRKRLAMDNVELINARTGEPRARPGRLLRKPKPVEPKDDPTITLPDEQTIEEYIERAQEWRDRLAQIRDWLDVIAGSPDDSETARTEEGRERLEDRIRRQIREHGYAWARADHLIDEHPTFIVYNLLAEGVRSRHLEDETLTITGRNLSTHPHLVEDSTDLRIESSRETFIVDLHFVPMRLGGHSQLALQLLDLPVDRITPQLRFRGEKPLSGGTIDVRSVGTWNATDATIEMPLDVMLRNSAISIAGSSPQLLDEMHLPLLVRGRIDRPVVLFSDQILGAALIRIGKNELASRLGVTTDEALHKLRDRIDDTIGDRLDDTIRDGIGDRLRDGLGGLLDRRN